MVCLCAALLSGGCGRFLFEFLEAGGDDGGPGANIDGTLPVDGQSADRPATIDGGPEACAPTCTDGSACTGSEQCASGFCAENLRCEPDPVVMPEGYRVIPRGVSGLGYEYMMMQFEASFASGTTDPATRVTTDEVALSRCNARFHLDGVIDPACGEPGATDAVAQSVPGVMPQTDVTFDQAFFACRNASNADYRVRLPTREEWLRAAAWAATDYNALWATYSDGGGNNCNVAGAVENTGSRSQCVTPRGVADVAGNVSEWIDERLARYDISGNGESRLGVGPIIGRTVANGIAFQTASATPRDTGRLHEIDPGVAGLALTLGADTGAPPAPFQDTKQYGVDVQRWLPPQTASNRVGFRCVAISRTAVTEMSALSMPREPAYVAADASGPATAWRIPENLFVHDRVAEEVSIEGDVASGGVRLRFRPWNKESCVDAACSRTTTTDDFVYEIYRFEEPTRRSERLAVTWALSGGSNPYATDTPLDPLAVDAADVSRFTPVGTVAGCHGGAPSACEFFDAGAGFSTTGMYRYVLVARDGNGNRMPAMVQRFRSPFFVGLAPAEARSASRQELRYRRAAVFVVDRGHMASQSAPQQMVYVPMHQSGLDHDFFVHMYDASYVPGMTGGEDAMVGNHPLTATATGQWLSNGARCHDTWLRTGVITNDASLCGTFGPNSRTPVLQSIVSVAPVRRRRQGTMWRLCHNTPLSDGPHAYRLSLPTAAEWSKAADWGDVDHDGDIDQHELASLIGRATVDLEFSSYSTPDVGCNTHSGAENTGRAVRDECVSRYGAQGMIGNVWNWAYDRIFDDVGLDNGIDGLWFGVQFRTDDYDGTGSGRGPIAVDLLRGAMPLDESAGQSVRRNDDRYLRWKTSGLVGALPGGGWYANESGGRWHMWFNQEPGEVSANGETAVRCIF